jgi:hypothetical protein
MARQSKGRVFGSVWAVLGYISALTESVDAKYSLAGIVVPVIYGQKSML